MKFIFNCLILSLLGFASTRSVLAENQIDLDGYVHQVTLEQNGTTTRIRQIVSPVQIRMPLLKGNLDFQSAFMYIEQTDPLRQEIQGALDTRISGSWMLGTRGLLTVQASIPTGKRDLNTLDANLVQFLARNDLNFPVKTFGEGLDVGGALSLAHQKGHVGFSLGFGVLRRGEYDPGNGLTNYKPGDEATLTLGLDYTRKRMTYRITGTGTFYFTDRHHGAAVFQNGKQLLLQAGMQYRGRSTRLAATVTEIARLKNRESTPARFLFEIRDSNGNDFRAQLDGSWTPFKFVTMFATGYFKHLTANAHPVGNSLYLGRSYLWEGGGGLSFSFGKSQHFIFRMTRMEGKAGNDTIRLSATNFRGGLKFQF